jgi:hypothetical protein
MVERMRVRGILTLDVELAVSGRVGGEVNVSRRREERAVFGLLLLE